MENSEHSNGNRFCFDDVVIERDNFRVCKDGLVKSLTPKAFDVLIFLIENRGRVVEKQEIFETIWKETFVTDNALMRAIKEIRRELGDEVNAPRYIETVHKRGYRFIGEIKSEPPAVAGGLNDSELRNADFEFEEEPIRIPKPQIPNSKWLWVFLPVALLIIGAIAFWFYDGNRSAKQIESIAVLPFVNESDNADMEYLSDGMTETLIGSLSQIPNLSVKARSSVFRYKGKDKDAAAIGKELNVRAILTGRVVQHGEDLTLYLSLIDANSENNLWSKQYNRKLTNIISLQSEIARDVAANLQTKLSGADEQRVSRSYTENAEAYQLYLKGRFYLLKMTPAAHQTAISYFEQAIQLDPNYALAYTGLSGVHLAHALGGEMPPAEVFPKAKAAANKAVEIDDQLAEAHTELCQVSFWYDWNPSQAEYHIKRALELNPNYADAHLFYTGLLAISGRGAEAINEGKRTVELDPLNLRTNTLVGQYLVQAGRMDNGLTQILKTIELEPNFYLSHQFAANAYIEKGMYAEAIYEARLAKELSRGSPTIPMSFLGYALAKSGRQTEARAVLGELLKMSEEKYISPYVIALIYNALDERKNTLKWLEHGIEKRDPRMVLLKIEPKWNNLRDDVRFQEIMRRVGLPQ